MGTSFRDVEIKLAPREARILQTVFDRVWGRISSDHPEQSRDVALIRKQLARKLIRLMQAGVRDPKRLATLACGSLEEAART